MPHLLSAETLQDLTPVHRLNRDQRARLAQGGQVAAIPAGKKLTATQEYPWLDYVLTGKLCLLKGDQKEIIDAGSMRACRPLFESGRLRDSAIILNDAELLRLDRQLYETFSGDSSTAGDSLNDLELSESESALLVRFYQACKSGSLALPSLPKVARAIQEAMSDPSINSARLARIVQMDPAAAGGLIRLANSPIYRGSKPTVDVRNAIIRLGMDITRGAVVGMAMQQIFKTKSPLMKHRMKAVWNRSVHISALSFVIARHCAGFHPEQALLAGLLHDVGEIPILDFVSRLDHEISDEELDAAIIKLRGMVGELVVSYWGLGSELVDVVRESGNWHRDRGNRPDECDIVLVARLYRMNQSESRGPLPRYDEVPAYFKLGLGFSETEGKVDVLAEASEELAAVIGMLKGAHG
jgi:HD-like signal output (HDOD) protein